MQNRNVRGIDLALVGARMSIVALRCCGSTSVASRNRFCVFHRYRAFARVLYHANERRVARNLRPCSRTGAPARLRGDLKRPRVSLATLPPWCAPLAIRRLSESFLRCSQISRLCTCVISRERASRRAQSPPLLAHGRERVDGRRAEILYLTMNPCGTHALHGISLLYDGGPNSAGISPFRRHRPDSPEFCHSCVSVPKSGT